MKTSQEVAAAVALRALGKKVTTTENGALVSEVKPGFPAAHGLRPTDVIVAVDGKPVRKTDDLRRLITAHPPGTTIRLGVRGAKGIREVDLKTIADPHNPKRAVIGVIVLQASQAKLPIPVRIDTGSIGGPSAGLAFALDVLEELGHRVDRGYKVAATGEIFLDGAIGPIGGVRQKIFGARQAGVDIMLVPAGDNAAIARRYAGHVRVIAVKSFRQALRALATLPPKR
jgi:PDZ domain-containing protein